MLRGAERCGASICSAPHPAPCSPVARVCRPSPTHAPRSSHTAGWGWPSALPRSGRSVSHSGPRTSQGSRLGAGCCGRGHGAIRAPDYCWGSADWAEWLPAASPLRKMSSRLPQAGSDMPPGTSGHLAVPRHPFQLLQLTPPPSMPWWGPAHLCLLFPRTWCPTALPRLWYLLHLQPLVTPCCRCRSAVVGSDSPPQHGPSLTSRSSPRQWGVGRYRAGSWCSATIPQGRTVSLRTHRELQRKQW